MWAIVITFRPSSVVRPSTFHILIFSSETTGPIATKLEISSNGQNCFIFSQNVPKFEPYKHNDELFSMYDRIFYELWTFADFDQLCKLEKRGDEI